MRRAMNLDGKTVLLTGATGGIGQATARRLAAAGAHLVITGRRGEVLEELARELGARAIAVDLAERSGGDALLAQAGPVDVLVANAGLQAPGTMEEHSGEDLDRRLTVNLRA